jgi:perosamine synthetase
MTSKHTAAEWIPIAGPWVTDKEVQYTADAAANAWYANANVYPARFEKAFAEYLGVAHAVSLPSCTSALHLALAALDIGPGDEVIVPDATWIASSAPVEYVGGTPVFADIDTLSWCLDASAVERTITSRTKAIIVVHLYGNMTDMDAAIAIARRQGVAVIEDAAEAIGSEFRGRKAGSFGDVGTFSFHGSKTLTTGEGGMLVTNRRDIYERVLLLRDHGRQPGDRLFVNHEIAFKYKMSALQAAFGLAQLERIDELVARKREIFGWYAKYFAGVNGVTLNHEGTDTKNTYWMVTALFNPDLSLSKEAVIEALRQRNIDSRPFFYPLSSLPAYRGLGGAEQWKKQNPVAYAISPWGVNLPSGFNLSESDVERVVDSVNEIIARHPVRLKPTSACHSRIS